MREDELAYNVTEGDLHIQKKKGIKGHFEKSSFFTSLLRVRWERWYRLTFVHDGNSWTNEIRPPAANVVLQYSLLVVVESIPPSTGGRLPKPWRYIQYGGKVQHLIHCNFMLLIRAPLFTLQHIHFVQRDLQFTTVFLFVLFSTDERSGGFYCEAATRNTMCVSVPQSEFLLSADV